MWGSSQRGWRSSLGEIAAVCTEGCAAPHQVVVRAGGQLDHVRYVVVDRPEPLDRGHSVNFLEVSLVLGGGGALAGPASRNIREYSRKESRSQT